MRTKYPITIVAIFFFFSLSVCQSAWAQPKGVKWQPRNRLTRSLQNLALDARLTIRQLRCIQSNQHLTLCKKVKKSCQTVVHGCGWRRPPAVLLFQGAFDPFHLEHGKSIERCALGMPNLGQVYVVPTSEHPGKHPEPYAHRVAMTQLAIAACTKDIPSKIKIDVVNNPRIARLSTEGFNDLMRMIHSKHPGSRVYIMTGADAFLTAGGNGNTKKALSMGYRYAVNRRAGYDLPSQLPVGVELMPGAGKEVSSTAIRNELKASRIPHRSLQPSVADYIEKHNLYGYGKNGAIILGSSGAPQ